VGRRFCSRGGLEKSAPGSGGLILIFLPLPGNSSRRPQQPAASSSTPAASFAGYICTRARDRHAWGHRRCWRARASPRGVGRKPHSRAGLRSLRAACRSWTAPMRARGARPQCGRSRGSRPVAHRLDSPRVRRTVAGGTEKRCIVAAGAGHSSGWRSGGGLHRQYAQLGGGGVAA
jgi:hypothetical protein